MDAAIQEGDPKAQNDLIQAVLSMNTELSEFLRGMIGDISRGDKSINSASVDELNAELVKYQQEFEEVKKSQDIIKTLRKLRATNQGLADGAVRTYYIYLTIIGILIVICVYFTISTAWTSSLFQKMSTASSQVAT
jgi:hypothetical protein